MTINERFALIRKDKKLSGEKFGEPLGIKRSAVSLIENGDNNVTAQMVKAICHAYHVSERWLRTGEGEMYEDESIEDYIRDENLSPDEAELLKAYFSIDKETRQKAVKQFLEFIRKEDPVKRAEENYLTSTRSTSAQKAEDSASSTEEGTITQEQDA